MNSYLIKLIHYKIKLNQIEDNNFKLGSKKIKIKFKKHQNLLTETLYYPQTTLLFLVLLQNYSKVEAYEHYVMRCRASWRCQITLHKGPRCQCLRLVEMYFYSIANLA